MESINSNTFGLKAIHNSLNHLSFSQRSILGLALFIVYINDLMEGIQSSGQLLADEAKLYRRITTSLDEDCIKDQDTGVEQQVAVTVQRRKL